MAPDERIEADLVIDGLAELPELVELAAARALDDASQPSGRAS